MTSKTTSKPKRLVVAIDGPSGAGKSTISKILAARLHFTYIDTGAMYRCVALEAKKQHIAVDDEAALARLCREIDIRFQWEGKTNRVFCNGEEVTEEIRTPEMDMLSSAVSAVPAVREALVAMQRRMGEKGPVILEGRDAGTVIFPQAEVKVYLDASPQVRGRRRFLEQQQRGLSGSLEQVIEEIRKRDLNDSSRAHSPLAQAADAHHLDTTGMDIPEVVEAITELIREKAGNGD
ncbi:MAG: (d)CMP kinase [Deltaproteobacteria bacterium]|nr:MAG: (d)CMP kinase [Deltaproteobacteria bacterium]